jgi:hypothetical protein
VRRRGRGNFPAILALGGVLPGGEDIAHRFRNRAALFSLRAESGFAPVPQLRFYSEVADLYKTMALAANELSRLKRLLKAVEQNQRSTDQRKYGLSAGSSSAVTD